MRALFLCIAFRFTLSPFRIKYADRYEPTTQLLKSNLYQKQASINLLTLKFDLGQLQELLWTHSYYDYLIKTVRK